MPLANEQQSILATQPLLLPAKCDHTVKIERNSGSTAYEVSFLIPSLQQITYYLLVKFISLILKL